MSEIKNSTSLLSELKRTLWRQRLVGSFSGLLFIAGSAIAVGIILSLLASFMIVPVWLKTSLLVLTGLALVYALARYVFVPFGKGSIDSVAISLEDMHPGLKGRMIATIQFLRNRDNRFSQDFIDLTERQALQKAATVAFGRAVRLDSIWKNGRLLAGGLFLAVAILALSPAFFSKSFQVYSQPGTLVVPPAGYTVATYPGSTEWVKFRDIEIGGALLGDQFPAEAHLYHRLAGGYWQKTDFDLARWRRHATEIGDSLPFGITLRNVNRSFDYYLEAGRVKSDVYSINVVDRPRVNGIKLSIVYPQYTGLPPTVIDENNGSFSAVVGSRTSIDIATNLPIKEAALIIGDKPAVPLKVEGKRAEGTIRVKESHAYHIELTDRLGERNPDPIEYYVTAVPDEYPAIDILSPGFDVNLNDEMMLPLKVRIFDDFGFSSLVLKYMLFNQGRQSEEHVVVLHFSDRIKTEGEVEYNWDVDQLNLFPGDHIVYHFEVTDNDEISGPKTTRSRQFVARLPSLDEIIASSQADSHQQLESTEEMLRRGKEISQRIKEMSRKLKAQNQNSNKPDWQQQKELESVLNKNSELLDKVDETAEQMEKAIQRLSENALLSREIMEKLAQIQKLYEEVATPEMREAQKRLMDALKNMNRAEIEKALEEFDESQKEFLERLERTLALLKRMQAMQKMEAMIRKVEEMVEKQQAQNEKTENSPESDLPQLKQAEEELAQSLEDLKQEIAELEELLKNAKMEDVPQAKEFSEALEKTDADQDMKDMAESLGEQNRSESSKKGKKALSKLTQLLSSMQEQLAKMQGEEDEQFAKEMQMAIDDATYLSSHQEDLLKEAAELKLQSLALQEMAGDQQDIASACTGLKKRIVELGKKSPFIAAELQELVGQAMNGMKLAMEGFDTQRSMQARGHQRDAMVDLNRTALRLMESLEQQSQCKNGGSCSKQTAKLESMSKKQDELNKRTKNQCDNPGNSGGSKSSRESREALKRLAGEQGALRKSLEELSREFGSSRQLLGRLDDIAKEMQKVEEEMADGEIGAETTEKQLRIFSRMLEASRSLQRRDFSEQRKATTAGEQPAIASPLLPPDMTDESISLEDRLRNYLGKDYPPQYEEQIKAYFKALLQQPSDQPEVRPSTTE